MSRQAGWFIMRMRRRVELANLVDLYYLRSVASILLLNLAPEIVAANPAPECELAARIPPHSRRTFARFHPERPRVNQARAYSCAVTACLRHAT